MCIAAISSHICLSDIQGDVCYMDLNSKAGEHFRPMFGSCSGYHVVRSTRSLLGTGLTRAGATPFKRDE